MKTYKTKDFYLTALFMCKGLKLVGSEKCDHSVFFEVEYDDEENLHILINQFINFEAVVNMQKFKRVQARLRTELDKYKN